MLFYFYILSILFRLRKVIKFVRYLGFLNRKYNLMMIFQFHLKNNSLFLVLGILEIKLWKLIYVLRTFFLYNSNLFYCFINIYIFFIFSYFGNSVFIFDFFIILFYILIVLNEVP